MGRVKKIMDKGVVLEAALGLIEAEGIEGFSTRKLAAALKLSAMTLYNYYENREAILKAVALRGLEDFFLAFEARAAEMSRLSPNPLFELKALAMEFMRFGRERPRLYLFLFDSSLEDIRHDPQVSRYFSHLLDKCSAGVSDQEARERLRTDILLYEVLANGLVINLIRGRTILDEERYRRYIDQAYERLLMSHEEELRMATEAPVPSMA